MRVKVQKHIGRLLGCCVSIPPEMMDALVADILNDNVELSIEKLLGGLLINAFMLAVNQCNIYNICRKIFMLL